MEAEPALTFADIKQLGITEQQHLDLKTTTGEATGVRAFGTLPGREYACATATTAASTRRRNDIGPAEGGRTAARARARVNVLEIFSLSFEI